MKKAKVDVLIALYCYGGNGGTSSLIPEIALWLMENSYKMRQDERIGRLVAKSFSDTPITMTRNQAMKLAKENGFDMVLMLDSDNEPDGYLKSDPEAKPFWDVAFDLAYERLVHGKPSVIAAPYCGPPPHPTRPGDEGEVPYLFQWLNNMSDEQQTSLTLHRLNRNEAALMRGVHRVGAIPTGVCLITVNVCEGLEQPYFRYEMNPEGTEKQSTEDVVFSRNASLLWQEKIGENVVFAACDSWALHHKPKKVGRPTLLPIEVVAKDFRDAVLANHQAGERTIELDLPMPPNVVPEPVVEDSHKTNGHAKSFRYKRRKFHGEEIPETDLEAIENIAEVVAQYNGHRPTAMTIRDNDGIVATVLADAGFTSYVLNGGEHLEKNASTHFGSAVRNVANPTAILTGDSQDCKLVVLVGDEGASGSTMETVMRHVAASGALVMVADEDSPAIESLLRLCDSVNAEPRHADGTNVFWITKEEFTRNSVPVVAEAAHG